MKQGFPNEVSSRSVFMRDIRSFLLRPIPRSLADGGLRGDGAAVRAFTLVELLVVVLIIGILSAIAIPMYQGAVDKSHWSTMLPASKAIKDAEEAFKMTNGEYSDTMEHLDVQMNNSDLTFTLNTPNNLADPNVIKVTNSKLGDRVRLVSYLNDSPKFAGQLHCEAKNEGSTPNERGQRLCEKLLGGQYLKTTDDGYTRYLLDQAVDSAICKEATGSWSSSQTKCYKDTATRCEALGLPVLENAKYPDQCGSTGNIVQAEGACLNSGCSGKKIERGGVCLSDLNGASASTCDYRQIQGAVVCNGNNACGFSSTIDGGVCIVNSIAGGGCGATTFKNGSVCFANTTNSCTGTYAVFQDTSCCCGNFCGSKPKCDTSRCDAVKAQYADYFND